MRSKTTGPYITRMVVAGKDPYNATVTRLLLTDKNKFCGVVNFSGDSVLYIVRGKKNIFGAACSFATKCSYI